MVRYRFDEDDAYIGEWPIHNQTGWDYSKALNTRHEVVYDLAEGMANNKRLLYEIASIRSELTFSQAASLNAVLHLDEKCNAQ